MRKQMGGGDEVYCPFLLNNEMIWSAVGAW